MVESLIGNIFIKGSLQPKNVQPKEVPPECSVEEVSANAETSQPKAIKNVFKQNRAKCYYSKNVVPGHAGMFVFFSF